MLGTGYSQQRLVNGHSLDFRLLNCRTLSLRKQTSFSCSTSGSGPEVDWEMASCLRTLPGPGYHRFFRALSGQVGRNLDAGWPEPKSARKKLVVSEAYHHELLVVSKGSLSGLCGQLWLVWLALVRIEWA